MFRRVVSALIVLLVAALLLVAAWPQLLGIQRESGVVQVTTMRGLLTAVALLGFVLFGVIALISQTLRAFAGALAVLLLAFSGIQLAVLSTRGGGDTAFAEKQAGDLTVLVWNTLGDGPEGDVVATLVAERDADIVVLPETSEDYGRFVAAASGLDLQVIPLAYDPELTARSTVVLIDRALGEYVLDESRGGTETLPSVLAVPVSGSGPVIVGAHPVAPVPGEMTGWRQGLQWLAARCQGENVILAGDLNSTLDHYTGLDPTRDTGGGLSGCRDGARATGNAAVGTWPVELPTLLGAPIDHVMATDAWEFVGFEVITALDGAGSDHRPIVAQLRPAG
ncbi:endonuclease/exonuclease/phosphatase family protein [Pseudolysinimonas sp.]